MLDRSTYQVRSRPLVRMLDVLREVPAELHLGEEGRAAIRRLVRDLGRYVEPARESPTGEAGRCCQEWREK